MSKKIRRAGLSQAFHFTKGFCVCDQTALMQGTGCLPPDLKAHCRVLNVHSKAISTTKACTQIWFPLFFSQWWLCETATGSHGSGHCLTAGSRPGPDRASAVPFANLLYFPETGSLIRVFVYLFFPVLSSVWMWTKVLLLLLPSGPLEKWWTRRNGRQKMQTLICVACSLPFWSLHSDLMFLIHF